MTPLTKPVTRSTLYKHRGRHLVVTLHPGDVLGVRHFRTRKEYVIPLSWCFDAAVKAEVARIKAERKKRRA